MDGHKYEAKVYPGNKFGVDVYPPPLDTELSLLRRASPKGWMISCRRVRGGMNRMPNSQRLLLLPGTGMPPYSPCDIPPTSIAKMPIKV
jgi:hypothetical protein